MNLPTPEPDRRTSVIAKSAFVLSVIAVALSVFALATRHSGAASHCGARGNRLVTCTGNGPPSSSFGTCAPTTRIDGVMFWVCDKPKKR
jgi:hypothetical protein